MTIAYATCPKRTDLCCYLTIAYVICPKRVDLHRYLTTHHKLPLLFVMFLNKKALLNKFN